MQPMEGSWSQQYLGARVHGQELFGRQAAVTGPQDFLRAFLSRRETKRVYSLQRVSSPYRSGTWEPTVRYYAVGQTRSIRVSAMAEPHFVLGPNCSDDEEIQGQGTEGGGQSTWSRRHGGVWIILLGNVSDSCKSQCCDKLDDGGLTGNN